MLVGAFITAARDFVVNVVAKPAGAENQLPLKEARLREIFIGDSTTVHNFFMNQHCFCTLTLFQDGTHMVLDDDDTIRLPYIWEREIGNGGFGSVWEVEIPSSYFVVRNYRGGSIDSGGSRSRRAKRLS
ncbi:hypothetical protein F4824DRAFT_461065 [Ustulina deusta]|nr:hypothetical protein F4824DRAFT_461065 [Ustulina deusta]